MSIQNEPSKLELTRAMIIQSSIRHLRFLQDEIERVEKELKILVPKTGLSLRH